MNAYDVIKDAIENKRQVIARYAGHRRELCVHALGVKNGRRMVLAYQFGGTSRSMGIEPGNPANWRVMELDRLFDVVVRGGVERGTPWYSPYNYAGPNAWMDETEVQVRA